ncbi:hypothetical protein DL96DRAFT_1608140 [Flagelloscypha sp. PMI_526]|nr:hypothetical protein DL96DRAFT_1608140 [Flagelloscypha sp. PMI_526]
MLFKALTTLSLLAISLVSAVPAQVRDDATITEPTVLTAKKVVHTLIDHSPFIQDFTTTIVFTQLPPSATPSA